MTEGPARTWRHRLQQCEMISFPPRDRRPQLPHVGLHVAVHGCQSAEGGPPRYTKCVWHQLVEFISGYGLPQSYASAARKSPIACAREAAKYAPPVLCTVASSLPLPRAFRCPLPKYSSTAFLELGMSAPIGVKDLLVWAASDAKPLHKRY